MISTVTQGRHTHQNNVCQGNAHTYSVSISTRTTDRGTLVDRGANGGLIGADARVFLKHQKVVDVRGIDNHELSSLPLVDATAKVTMHVGDVIVILRQYAYLGLGRTIHSSGQIEHYKNSVDDRSMIVGGRQCIKTLEGYIIPLNITAGLPYMDMHSHTDSEFEKLPHVILTAGEEWNPNVLDYRLTDKEDWKQTLKDLDTGIMETPFSRTGEYLKREPLYPIIKDLPSVAPMPSTGAVSVYQADTSWDCPLDVNVRYDMYVTQLFSDAADLNQRYIPQDDPQDLEVNSTNIIEEIPVEDRETATRELPKPYEVRKLPINYCTRNIDPISYTYLPRRSEELSRVRRSMHPTGSAEPRFDRLSSPRIPP